MIIKELEYFCWCLFWGSIFGLGALGAVILIYGIIWLKLLTFPWIIVRAFVVSGAVLGAICYLSNSPNQDHLP